MEDINNFEQGGTESLDDSWVRLKYILKICPSHGLEVMAHGQ